MIEKRIHRDQIKMPGDVLELLGVLSDQGAYIAGGAARWVYLQNLENMHEYLSSVDANYFDDSYLPSDIDIYHRFDQIDNVEQVGDILVDRGYLETHQPMEYVYQYENPAFSPHWTAMAQHIVPYESEYVITYGSPASKLNTFGFTTEQFAMWEEGEEVVFLRSAAALVDTGLKQLVVNHVTHPIHLISRTGKYARKGYVIYSEQIEKILLAYESRPLEYRVAPARAMWQDGTFVGGSL